MLEHGAVAGERGLEPPEEARAPGFAALRRGGFALLRRGVLRILRLFKLPPRLRRLFLRRRRVLRVLRVLLLLRVLRVLLLRVLRAAVRLRGAAPRDPAREPAAELPLHDPGGRVARRRAAELVLRRGAPGVEPAAGDGDAVVLAQRDGHAGHAPEIDAARRRGVLPAAGAELPLAAGAPRVERAVGAQRRARVAARRDPNDRDADDDELPDELGKRAVAGPAALAGAVAAARRHQPARHGHQEVVVARREGHRPPREDGADVAVPGRRRGPEVDRGGRADGARRAAELPEVVGAEGVARAARGDGRRELAAAGDGDHVRSRLLDDALLLRGHAFEPRAALVAARVAPAVEPPRRGRGVAAAAGDGRHAPREGERAYGA